MCERLSYIVSLDILKSSEHYETDSLRKEGYTFPSKCVSELLYPANLEEDISPHRRGYYHNRSQDSNGLPESHWEGRRKGLVGIP